MHYFFDKDKEVRYTLVSTNGRKPLNWILVPGGPGCDSSFYLDLVKLLDLPGNTWFLDLPGNGSNNPQKDNFDNWFSLFVPAIKGFTNPVIIGSSFGGMFPLLFDELENILKGLVIISSAPCLWLDPAIKAAKERNLPSFSKDLDAFAENPNQETFEKALNACMPYYFTPTSLDEGRKLFENTPFSYKPALWWIQTAVKMSFNAKWVPEQVKTLIIGGDHDVMTPFSLFQNDKRFHRENIKMKLINDAGHCPWIEKPAEVLELIKDFENSLDIT